jgi:hypothetical protein
MKEQVTDKYRLHLMLCAGTACVSNKSFKIREVLEEEFYAGRHILSHINRRHTPSSC